MLPPCGVFCLPLDKLLLALTCSCLWLSVLSLSLIPVHLLFWLENLPDYPWSPLEALMVFQGLSVAEPFRVHLFMTRQRHEMKGQCSVFLSHSDDSLAKCIDGNLLLWEIRVRYIFLIFNIEWSFHIWQSRLLWFCVCFYLCSFCPSFRVYLHFTTRDMNLPRNLHHINNSCSSTCRM